MAIFILFHQFDYFRRIGQIGHVLGIMGVDYLHIAVQNKGGGKLGFPSLLFAVFVAEFFNLPENLGGLFGHFEFGPFGHHGNVEFVVKQAVGVADDVIGIFPRGDFFLHVGGFGLDNGDELSARGGYLVVIHLVIVQIESAKGTTVISEEHQGGYALHLVLEVFARLKGGVIYEIGEDFANFYLCNIFSFIFLLLYHQACA